MWTDTKWARDLCRHFDTEGTPVMVGGGVLAYTMVGVDFNEVRAEGPWRERAHAREASTRMHTHARARTSTQTHTRTRARALESVAAAKQPLAVCQRGRASVLTDTSAAATHCRGRGGRERHTRACAHAREHTYTRLQETGDVAYLILDPHYTGADEVKPVHAGGWVGWKRGLDAKGGTGGLVFDKASFYNLLLPLRPKTV